MSSSLYSGKDARPGQPAEEPSSGITKRRLALWLPSAATAGVLGLTCWQAQQRSRHGPRGVAALTFAFFGDDAEERWAASCMVANLASPLLLWTVEGYRVGNERTLLVLPGLFGAAVQVLGMETVAPIYYLASIITTTARKEEIGSVDPDVARAALAATTIGHVVPGILMSVLPLTATEVSRSYLTLESIVCHLFYFSPITVSLLTTGIFSLTKWVRRSRSSLQTAAVDGKTLRGTDGDRTHYDLAPLKTTYAAAFTYQVLQHFALAASSLWRTSHSWSRRLTAPKLGYDLCAIARALMPITSSSSASFLIDRLALYNLATVAFGLYTVWDLRRRDVVTGREARWAALGCFAGSVLAGPGAQYAGLWYWRECVLARHPC